MAPGGRPREAHVPGGGNSGQRHVQLPDRGVRQGGAMEAGAVGAEGDEEAGPELRHHRLLRGDFRLRGSRAVGVLRGLAGGGQVPGHHPGPGGLHGRGDRVRGRQPARQGHVPPQGDALGWHTPRRRGVHLPHRRLGPRRAVDPGRRDPGVDAQDGGSAERDGVQRAHHLVGER
ncbi:unnamed protein product [Ectocarpus sp. 13 AM-2016]